MKINKYILPAFALTMVLAGCDEQIMEWKPSDPSVSPSDIPLQLQEKIANYAPIKQYVQQYHPNLNLALGMGADNYINDPEYRAIVNENFTGVTLGNAMKHQSVVSASGTMNFATIDQVIALLPSDMKLYGHNFLWHTQQQQTYLKSLIAPKLVQDGGASGGISNVLVGDASDFEGGTSGGWGSWGSNKEDGQVEDGAGKDGSKGMVLKNKGDGNNWEAQFAYTFDVPLKQGVTYKIQFYAKSTSPAGKLQFQYQNGTSYGSQGGYNDFAVGTDWTLCEYEFTINDYDDVNRIILNFGAVGATYYLDDIQFGEYTPEPMDNVLVGDSNDFEGGTTGGWGSWGSNKKDARVEKGAGKDGSNGLILENNGDGNFWEAQCAYTFEAPLKQGETYIVQFDAKSTSAAGVLQFQYQNSTTYGSQGCYAELPVGTDWTQCEAEFTMSDYSDVDRIIINFGKVGATYYVDNIKFGPKKATATRAMTRAAAYHYELKTPEEKREILLGAMEEWIKAMCEHVGDRVDAWDVVNEPIMDGSNKWRGFDGAFMNNGEDEEPDMEPEESAETGLDLHWLNGSGNGHWYWGYFIGRDYAAKAFQFARKYAPNAKLFVNDYNLETSPSKLDALIEFVNYIDQNGGQVDGIGTQMHVQAKSLTREQVDAMFKKMAATGKLVRITELDVALGTATPSAEEQQTQADCYKMIIESYFQNVPESQQSAITIWTLSDNKKEHEYWLNGDAPNLFDANYGRKIAYKSVCDAIAGFDVSEGFKGEDWKDLNRNEEEEETPAE